MVKAGRKKKGRNLEVFWQYINTFNNTFHGIRPVPHIVTVLITYNKEIYGQHSTIHYQIIQQVLYGLGPSIRPITTSIKEKQNSSHIRSSKTRAIKGGSYSRYVFVQYTYIALLWARAVQKAVGFP